MSNEDGNKTDEEYRSGEEGNHNNDDGKKEGKKIKTKRINPKVALETSIFVIKAVTKKCMLLSTVLADFQPGACSKATIVFHQSRYDDLKKRFEDQIEQLFIACSYFSNAEEIYDQNISITEDGEAVLKVCNERLCALQDGLQPAFHTAPNTPILTGPPIPTGSSFSFKLEKIKVPTFDGKFNEWEAYRDLFTAAVDSNINLSAVEKMFHLSASLKGEASDVIRSYSHSQGSYAEAWAAVKQRYDNPREIVFAHIRKFDTLSNIHDNATDLRKIVDHVNELRRSLEVHYVLVDSWDVFLVYHVLKKLETETRQQWLLTQGTALPKLNDLLGFLEKRATALTNFSKVKGGHQSSSSSKSSHAAISRGCTACNETHPLYKCDSFNKMNPQEREGHVKKNRLCFNCLANHQVKECQSKGTCKKCHKKHNTLLHQEKSNQGQVQQPQAVASTSSSTTQNSSNVISSNCVTSCHVLLQTALVNVTSASGKVEPVRVFIDNGSNSELITESCASRLGLKPFGPSVPLTGIGGVKAGSTSGKVHLTLKSRTCEYNLPIKAEVVQKVTGGFLPTRYEQSNFPHVDNLHLADPGFYKPQPVDLILGSRYAIQIKTGGLIKGPHGTPSAEETFFGWVLSGDIHPSNSSEHHHVMSHFADSDQLDQILTRFWEYDEPEPAVIPRTIEDQYCEDVFSSTTTRSADGRYILKLPFKPNHEPLGSSYEEALKRLRAVERRCARNPTVRQEYTDYFNLHISSHIIDKVPHEELQVPNDQHYYMPYSEVMKSSSTSTKFRVVFDCSVKTFNGPSLNDILLPGPKLQVDLTSLIFRFRSYPFAFSADIPKFFNQFEIAPEHRDYQRLLYRENPSAEIQHLRFRRVTFGNTSAPYMSIRALHQLFNDECTSETAKRVIKEDTLVDNVISGSFCPGELFDLQQHLIQTLQKGQLGLKKWASNFSSLLESVPPEDREIQFPLVFGERDQLGTLGLLWNPFNYVLKINMPNVDSSSSTKRGILSVGARIFDPTGFISPVTIRIKIMIQDLWKLKIGWDEPLPEQQGRKWNKILQDLQQLSLFEIPRSYFSMEEGLDQSIQLIGFCDASNKAYAAVIYARTRSFNGKIRSSLVGSKTKVAPVQGDTTPRLELSGARLLSKYMSTVIKSLRIPVVSVQCYTDSMGVLGQILRSSDEKQTVFVLNRVRAIHQAIPAAEWFHVDGVQNPADIASRGISSQDFLNHALWLSGPPWLTTMEFPDSDPSPTIHSVQKISVDPLIGLINDSSSLENLKWTVASLYKNINNLSSKDLTNNVLSPTDYEAALKHIIKSVQREQFSEEIRFFKDSIISSKELKALTPFLDQQGIVRVGGRLFNSNLSESSKHPVLLPKYHHFTNMIFRNLHNKHLHAGPTLLLSLFREEFWVARGLSHAKSIVHRCILCHKYKPVALQQQMGNLPKPRVIMSRPFTSTGMDFGGPFYIATKPGRKPTLVKTYFCVFVCMATKAVHLESVGDLSAASFLAALHRFVSRRGRPGTLYSDGGTNFIGTKNEMKELQDLFQSTAKDESVKQHFVKEGISFLNIPPKAPHHGGLWEAAVKSTKFHLRRIMGDRHLSLEEFSTLLCQIEALLNSRPLIPMSEDPADYRVLTPGHFLIGDHLQAVPQRNLLRQNENSLSRWEKQQQVLQHFWDVWSKDYLQLLQSKPKWLKSRPNVQPGQLVLVQDSTVAFAPGKWNIARVHQLYPGQDGMVRVVSVKYPNGTILKRPIVKISPLPLETN